jgi:phage baseplate assembly protein W|tara:strand:+ start:5229 stop:5666 length:438 start_codon:yes stop_codon:yes gene_type:complete
MAKKLYNNKVVSTTSAQVIDNTRSFTYKGFSSVSSISNYKIYDIDLVKQDIINHFYIRKGEKLENPEFGTVIWDILFEPFTENVKEIISKDVEDIINYDPRIAVQDILIDTTDQGIRIQADILYLPFNINERMTFNFDRTNSIIN